MATADDESSVKDQLRNLAYDLDTVVDPKPLWVQWQKTLEEATLKEVDVIQLIETLPPRFQDDLQTHERYRALVTFVRLKRHVEYYLCSSLQFGRNASSIVDWFVTLKDQPLLQELLLHYMCNLGFGRCKKECIAALDQLGQKAMLSDQGWQVVEQRLPRMYLDEVYTVKYPPLQRILALHDLCTNDLQKAVSVATKHRLDPLIVPKANNELMALARVWKDLWFKKEEEEAVNRTKKAKTS